MSLVSGGSLFYTALCFGVWLSVVVLYCSVFWCVVVCCCSVLLCVLACGCLLLFCTALCFGVWLSVVLYCSLVCCCSCCPVLCIWWFIVVQYCSVLVYSCPLLLSAQCVAVAVVLTGGLLRMLHELLRTCVDVRLFGCMCVPGLVSLECCCEAGTNFPSEFGRAAS